MKKGVVLFWLFFAILAVLRFWQSSYTETPQLNSCLKENIVGQGQVISSPERKDSGQVFVLSTRSISVSSTSLQCLDNENILIKIKTKLYPRLEYHDLVAFEGNINKPFNFKSEGGRSFDYINYLAKDGVYYEIKSGKILSIKNQDDLNINSALFKVKRSFVSVLEKSLGEPHAALAAGLVVGEKAALGKDLLDDFRKVGLIHIVVLSGYNITIVGDALRRIFSFLPRIWSIILGGLGIILFGMLVGGGATVVRSCFMASVALVADILRRDYSVVRALIFAGMVMIIQNPMIVLHDPSFQLSFLATLGLILLASPIEKRLRFIPEKFGLRGIVASTFATQIFVSPYILYTMGQISIIGVVVNILVLPFVPITMLIVFVCGAAGFISINIASIFGYLAHILLSYELFMVNKFASVPYAALNVPKFSGYFVVVFYIVFTIVYIVVARFPSIVSQFRFEKKSSM